MVRYNLVKGLPVRGDVQRQIDPVKLEQILTNAVYLAKRAKDKGLEFAPIGLSDISSQNGFMDFEARRFGEDWPKADGLGRAT